MVCPVVDISFAAEELGKNNPGHNTKMVLIGLLYHPSPLVREGAVLGLYHVSDEEVLGHLREILKNDASHGVRVAAQDVLDELAGK